TTPAKVESILSLIPELFDFTVSATKQAQLDALVQDSIDDADAWMQAYMGSSYGATGAGEVRTQARGQAYLAASYLLDTVGFKKLVGTHYPIDSEDSAEYERWITELEEKARGLLAKWITVEVGAGGTAGSSFAAPAFRAGPGVDQADADTEETLMEAIADRARGFAK